MPVQKALSVTYASDVQIKLTSSYRSSKTVITTGTPTCYLYNAKGVLLLTFTPTLSNSAWRYTIPGSYFATPGRYRLKAQFVTTGNETGTEEFDIFAVRGTES
jgi:hypothetical protein